jgi:hypothetical protein
LPALKFTIIIGLAVGEIPTLKTRAELSRNIMLYELLSDYEILHLQLQRIARKVVSLIRWRCCRRYSRSISPEELQMSKQFWRPLQVYAEKFIYENLLEHDKGFLIRFIIWLESKIFQTDIETHITYEKHWKKRNLKKKGDQENQDRD